ncbi:MAG: 2-oxoglutarate and iron-dependent oxygenase domain-containing protein [Caulobacteraceae bacterium]
MNLLHRQPDSAPARPRSLPIIDISDLASTQPDKRRAVGRRIGLACADRGFFYIVGHGVPETLIAETLAAARAFFDLPDAAKAAVDKSRSPANRGYEPLGGQTLEPGTTPDLKEGFYMGVEAAPGRFNQGANQWPGELPLMPVVLTAYHRELTALAERLMTGLALSLGLPEDFFAAFSRDPIAILRLLHYPPQPAASPGQGAGAHTDFGALTILLQDGTGGLEVYDRAADGWTPAPPIAGAYVVNLGDLIARWTNDRYRSTPHRVVNRSGRRRYSIPFFFSGAPDYGVTCLPGCLAPGETPKYPPTTVEAHMRERYRQTYGG